MLAFNFLSELGMKNMLTLLFLHLFLTQDVASMRGLTMEEVEIQTTPPCPECEEIVCTISSIEPEGSDTKYEKYIADSCQAKLLDSLWVEKPTVKTFEDCAAEADTAQAKMFLFDDGMCKVSPGVFEKMDQCNITQTQMVYIEAEATDPVLTVLNHVLTCDSDVNMECEDGRLVNKIDDKPGSCDTNFRSYRSYNSEYIIFTSQKRLTTPSKDTVPECEKFQARACAPEPGKDIAAFVEDLKDYASGGPIHVGLRLNDDNTTFTWASGISQTASEGKDGWSASEPKEGNTCVIVDGDRGLVSDSCIERYRYCCQIPYYAD